MRTSVNLHLDAHSPTPIHWPEAEPLTDVTEGGDVPRDPALPRELDAVGITPNAVARAIEDLKRSGYRPLHAHLAAPGPRRSRGRASPQGATCEHGEAEVIGEAYPSRGGRS
jgi:hypothetical protein